MTIKVGDKLPDATFKTMGADGKPQEMTTAQAFGGKKVALFAVPGAFTPGCTKTHLPSFMANELALKEKGLQEIFCTAVNDVFVMDAWAKATGAEGKVTMLADGAADFARKCGLEQDLSGPGLGVRSKRYAMIVDNGVVKVLNVEDKPAIEKSTAENLLTCSF